MDLKNNEILVCEEGGSYCSDFVAVGGRITLTTKRVLFVSNKKNPTCVSIEISLSDVDKVDYFKTLNVIPNGVMLMLADGSISSFVVDNRIEWKNRIAGLLGSKMEI